MALRKFLFQSAEGFSEEGAAADSLALGGLTMTGAIAMGTSKITGLADGVAADEAVNKGQLDQAVINGGAFREALLHEDQIDNAEGFLASIALVMAAQPVSGDLITTDDGTTTRTYGAVAGGDVQYALGASAALTMQALVDAINGDGSATCTAALSTDLLGIAGTVVVITEKDNDGGDHELYGVWATQSNVDVVDFSGELDYTKKALTDMPAASPAGTNFGVRRTQLSLTDGELHYVLNNDVIYGWDDAGNTWQVMSGTASIPDATGASGGGTKGKLTVDTDNGLSIAAGILSANIDAVTIDFNGGAMEVTGLPSLFEVNGTPVGAAVTAANLDSLTDGSDISGTLHSHDSDYADAAHVHTHASTTGQGTDDHHPQLHTVASHSDTTATGAELETLTDGSNADALHTHASATATEAPKVENTLAVDEAIVVADAVHFTATGDRVGRSDAANDSESRVIGIARTAQPTPGSTAEIVTAGECAGCLSGATPGTAYYLQAVGGIGTALPGAGSRVIQVGVAASADDLFVRIVDYGKKAA